MMNKVAPSTERQGPKELLVTGSSTKSRGPTVGVIPVTRRPLERLGSRLLQPVLETYRRLPRTTRRALKVGVKLVAVLYIFLTVPFRLAFYYDPYLKRDKEQVTHQWTQELTVFAAADAVADLIGLVQFVNFYHAWKLALVQVKSSARSERRKDPNEPVRANSTNLLVRAPSFSKTHGKTRWTIATVNAFASATDGVMENLSSHNLEFFFEGVALVPVEIFPLMLGTFNTLHLVRITKLCRVYRLRQHLARMAMIYSDRAWVQHLSSTGVDSLVRTIGLCAGMCHLVACGYMLIAHAQCGVHLEACDEHVETSWVVRDRLFGASVARKYGRTLYWSARTLVLLGYDDVTPVSNAETLYVIVITLLGALFGSSLLANFLFLFRFRNARYAAFSTHVDNAREYMRLRNIPQSVRHQVTAYFNYAWSVHHSLDSEEALQFMPKHLHSKVVSSLKASRIKQVCFLTKESVEFTNMLALALVRRIYSPGDYIVVPRTNAESFFVIRGTVVLSAFDGSKRNKCQAGDFFADSCLLFPEQYEQQAVAKTFCEVYVLAKTKFDEALVEYYRGDVANARSRMAETLEKYSTQLHKMKKLLGLRGAHESGSRKSSAGANSHSLMVEDMHSRDSHSYRGVNWSLPGSSFSVHWAVVRFAAIIFVAFEVPYFAVFISVNDEKQIFTVQREMGARYVLTLLIEVIFGVDLVLRSRFFAYLDQNLMINIVEPSLIFQAYKQNGFHLDLLAWLPAGVFLDSLPSGPVQGYSSIFRLLRLIRMRWIPTLLLELSDIYGASSKFRLILSLVLGVTLMLHFVGCLWFEMTMFSQDLNPSVPLSSLVPDLTRPQCLRQATQFQNCSWVTFDCYSHIGTVFPHEDANSSYQASFAYLRSVYWAVVTLTAVGYGDIVAYGTAESYFAALWIFVGGIINFGVVGAMSSTISNLLATHHHQMEKLNTINTILEQMEISDKLSAEIRRFYRNQFTCHQQAYESELLSHLPDQLCYEISSLLHAEAVKRVSLFESASIEFLKEVTGKFRHRIYQNGETICLEGDVCHEFFVLLPGSKINVFFRSRKVPIRALHGGDCYCVNDFILRRPYPATLSAASQVHASVMTRDQFDVIQRKFLNDMNNMKEEAEALWTQDQRLFRRITNNLEKLKLQPHSMQTPTLFYQRESAITPTNKSRQSRFASSRLRSRFQAIWKVIISFWNLYNAVFVIFRIGFHSHLHFSSNANISVWVADLCCDAFFAVDIYLHLYSFGNSDVGIENGRPVNLHYLRSSAFKWDLAASFPVYTPFRSESLTVSLCRLPRLIRCVNLWNYLDELIVQVQQRFATHNVSAYLSPAKLMIILVLVAHYVGCIFFLISEHECGHVERCWIEHDHMLHQYHHSVAMLYAKSFYWSITTLLLVGSRESVPRDTIGTLWTGFTCLCCTFIIGHIVGEISELILELGKEAKEFKTLVANFERFAKTHELPAVLRDRVGFFFREQFNHTKGNDLQGTTNDLSANLRLKLMLEVYGHTIATLPICRFLTSAQINNLVLRLKSELFIPGDNILVEGCYGNRLCTLRKGHCAAYWSKSVSSIAILMEGAFFGEIAFFLPNQRRLATVRATTFCEVLYISKNDWHELWSTTGSASDNQIQKHALHGILGWVSSRLQRYHHASLRIAKRSARLLRENTTKSYVSDEVKTRSSLSMMLNNNNGITRIATPPRKSSKTDLRRLFTSPEEQLLEMKAEYVLMKTDEFAKKFSPAIAMMQYHKSSILATIRSSLRNSIRSSFETTPRSRGGSNSAGAGWNSSNVDSSALSGTAKKEADIHLLQYILELNPMNKHVRYSLDKTGLISMEEECWERSRRLAEAQHIVSMFLNLLLPPETGLVIQRSRIKTLPGRKSFRRSQSWRSRNVRLSSSLESLGVATPTSLKNHAGASRKRVACIAVAPGKASTSKRRHSVAGMNKQGCLVPSSNSKTEFVTTLTRTARCFSLPAIKSDFFGDRPRKQFISTKMGSAGIDFEILQRCQMPQYVIQLHLYHHYRQWRGTLKKAVAPECQGLVLPAAYQAQIKRTSGRVLSLTGDMNIPSFRRFGRPRVAAMGSRLQLPSERALLSATTDLQSKKFIQRIKQAGQFWDFLILMVAIYHLIVTPFKVSFAHALVELPLKLLQKWSAFEMVLDALCFVDASFQLRHAYMVQQSKISIAEHSTTNVLRRFIFSSSDLIVYVVALLPVEVFLLSSRVRVSITHSATLFVDSSWWATRWVLRMNRLLLVRRIEPLSERLFQFAIHDLKISVSEPLLYFMRDLFSYLATGHILACIWFCTSEIGFQYYGSSWLSTSGMLTYISNGLPAAEHTTRLLSEGDATFSLASVSLIRKYLRSLLFSMECISTLFYGDILSMNTLELIAEIVITLWSIYIYGALVGAQAELLDARARREAAFEQRLGQLQQYVVQNGVPKALKRHIKTYYGRMWQRSHGEHEFAAVSCVSRALYEDVVLTTLRHFAAQVIVFRTTGENFLRGLLVCLQYVVCSENEEVFSIGDVDRSMYFIAQGRILLKTGLGEFTRDRGDHFGELTLLYGVSRLETSVALTVAELYRLDLGPYERLLIEFPEYRVRNKVAWTTLPDPDRLGSQVAPRPHITLASRPSIAKVAATTAMNVDGRLQYSFVHKATMKMLANMQTVHPLEAKDLILKCREAARRHLMRSGIPGGDENSDSSEEVLIFKESTSEAKPLRVFEKSRPLRTKAT